MDSTVGQFNPGRPYNPHKQNTPSNLFPRYPQRLRDAIDSRIAEEQARQKSNQEALSRSNSARLPQGPGRRPARPRRNTATPVRGPDPKEFEADFAIGDDDTPSRSGTPQPEPATGGDGAADENDGEKTAVVESGGKEAAAGDKRTGQNQALSELPPEVRAKLRRLDKMETRYHGMGWMIAFCIWVIGETERRG